MKRFLVLAMLLIPVAAMSQQPPPPENDPIGRNLAPPDLVMSHSDELGLTDKQRAAIKTEIQKMQAKFIDAQWDLQDNTSKMARLLQQQPVDEMKVLEQADKVMSLEREIKRAQLTLLIRIKNTLTAEQIAKLDALRRK